MTADDYLEPGETWTYVYDYAITQADLDTGYVLNTASVTAYDPSVTQVTGKSDGDANANADSQYDEDTDTTNDPLKTDLGQVATLSVVKSHVSANDNKAVAGGSTVWDATDTLAYSIAVTNTGNVRLDTVKLTDSLIPSSPVTLAPSL